MNAQEKARTIAWLSERLATSEAASEAAGDPAVHEQLRRLAAAARAAFRVPSSGPARALDRDALARLIDHTALKPETTEAQIRTLCEDAQQYGFASVCVNPCYVSLAVAALRGHPSKVCTVVGFPLGATQPASKRHEAAQALADGATELDMVLNVGMLKSRRYAFVGEDVAGVVETAKAAEAGAEAGRKMVKVILETTLLTEEEKIAACVLAREAGADFVKTSTGFSSGGAAPRDVALMRWVVGPSMGVKASGGVRSYADALAMIAHGATRIGASASVAILEGSAGSGY